MGLGRVDQEVWVLLRVDQEVGEGLVVHPKRAIGGRAVQELPGRARHLPDGGAGHRLLAKPTSHQPELLGGEALVLGDGKRSENGPEPFRPGAVIAPQLAAEEVAIDPGQATLGQRHPAGSHVVKSSQPVDATERLDDIKRVQEVPAGLPGDPLREHRHRGWLALRCEPALEVFQHVVTAWRPICQQVQARGAFP